MKWINSFKPMKIKNVDENDIEIKNYKENSWIISEEKREYFMVKRKFKNDINQNIPKIIELEKATVICSLSNRNEKNGRLYSNFGDENSFILDMNGIDNFRFASSEVFKDSTIRKIVKKMNLLATDDEYLRYGASGARKNGVHPGGEVFEYSLINGNECDGLSQNVSGYLPKGRVYSKSIPLCNFEDNTLLEERIVYSHTAWLKKCKNGCSNSIILNIKAKENNQSLLDIINFVAEQLGLRCFSIQIYVKSNNNDGTQIKGRVLKHMPHKAFKNIPEVVKISYERLFNLKKSEIMYGMGTKYERYEPEWAQFTNGGKYERRGHIHATIIYNKEDTSKKHETFHLRDAFISSNSSVEVVLTPINKIYRIYPIHQEKNEYICDSSSKKVSKLYEELREIDNK